MLPANRCVSRLLRNNPLFKITTLNKKANISVSAILEQKDKKSGIKNLFQPVPIEPNPDDINIGEELTGSLCKTELINVLLKFSLNSKIQKLANENGINGETFRSVFKNFKKYCLEATTLPVDLHIVLSDILQGNSNIHDIFPYFLRHAKQVYPHLDCIDELKQISDLRSPPNWYPLARVMTRKIIFHSGPTNSGKTYHALERFINSESGIYCGPLKLLATEVNKKCNDAGTPCDLVTGEERIYAKGEDNPSQHVSCTVEMVNLSTEYDVAVIDEIQLLRDSGRGWAWTRAFLGIPAKEIHVCGESGTVDLLHSLCATTGEEMEVRKYNRLTELIVQDKALLTIDNITKGDCIVCFSKTDIYRVTKLLEDKGIEVAVIYGSLPPGTKIAQAEKFNDPRNPCKVMVATDAIGMGLNLHIRRIIFYSLIKPSINEQGEREMNTISVSQALQIAGRAGRFRTQWETGYVTTFKADDLQTLQELLNKKPEPIMQAGLHPTAEQIELYSYHLPQATLSNLMDIFIELSTVDDSLYFLCMLEDFKFLADMIQHLPLSLKARYVFCCAPINRKFPFVCTMFVKFARQYCNNEAITFNWLCQQIGWSLRPPRTLLDLVHLETIFDVLDTYLWLSYRFPNSFPEANLVRDMQKELDQIIQNGVVKLTKLIKRNELNVEGSDDSFEIKTQRKKYISDKMNGQQYGKGSLTERLLQEGLLTPNMLSELQKEWSKAQRNQKDDNRTFKGQQPFSKK